MKKMVIIIGKFPLHCIVIIGKLWVPSPDRGGDGDDGGCNQTNRRGVPCCSKTPGIVKHDWSECLSTNWLAVVPSSPPLRQTVWQQWPKVWKIFSTLNRPLDCITARLGRDMNMLQISLIRIPLNCPSPENTTNKMIIYLIIMIVGGSRQPSKFHH